jgi:SPP1 gp7 family putative phage head morphogenesis protein
MAGSEALIESTTRHQVYLERLKSGEAKKFATFLKRIDKSIRDRLTSVDLTEFGRGRLERLLKSVDGDLVKIFDSHRAELTGSLVDIGQYEAGFEARNLSNAIQPDSFEVVIPAPAQVKAAILSAPLSVRGPDGGKLLDPFLLDWSRGERQRLTGAIRQGFYEGQTNFQILRAIRGTKANGYRDGLLNVTSNHADAVVRTAVQHSASVARFESWDANSDILSGYRWVSTLDGRTSPACRSLDGNVYQLGKGPKPPIHIRCRSTTVAELNDEFDFLQEGRTRASKDGYVGGDETYYSWLKKQPLEFQQDAIGKVRAKLLRDGGLSAEEFARLNLGRNFKPLSLAEMQAKEPLAFKRAFPEPKAAAIKKPGAKAVTPEPATTAFVEAKTTKEAAEWVVGNGYVSRADFGKLDITVVNEINRSLHDHVERFPDLKGSFSFVGSGQSLNRLKYEASYQHNRNLLRERYPDESQDFIDKYAKKYTKRSKMTGEWAFASPKQIQERFNGLDGIAFNEKHGSPGGLEDLKAGLKRSMESGFHPPGTDTVKSIMDHEIAHQIDYKIGLRKDPEIKALWQAWNGDKSELSGYARTNIAEFIAEGWAEYVNSPAPRDLAKAIGGIIEKRFK